MDYANRLDSEEATRSYINNLRSDYQARSNYGASMGLNNQFSTWGSSFGRATSIDSDAAYADRLRSRPTNLDAYRLSSRDIYSYKHYRKSNAVRSSTMYLASLNFFILLSLCPCQTLTERNTRAQSPIMSREIDRYYKTERRASYLGDISSGGHRDFRYYNYRHVPYYGGSDYYSYVPRVTRVWNNEKYPFFLPTYPVTTQAVLC